MPHVVIFCLFGWFFILAGEALKHLPSNITHLINRSVSGHPESLRTIGGHHENEGGGTPNTSLTMDH